MSQHASVSIFSKCRAQRQRQPSLSYIQSSILDSLISTNPNLWLKLLSRGFTASWSRTPFPFIILFCHLVVRCLHPLQALFPVVFSPLPRRDLSSWTELPEPISVVCPLDTPCRVITTLWTHVKIKMRVFSVSKGLHGERLKVFAVSKASIHIYTAQSVVMCCMWLKAWPLFISLPFASEETLSTSIKKI